MTISKIALKKNNCRRGFIRAIFTDHANMGASNTGGYKHGMNIDLRGHKGLKLWLQTLTDTVRSRDADLTSRQLALLLRVYLKEPPHTVRGLAGVLNVSKPVITRAVDTLSALGLVKRIRDETDKRNVLIQRTVKGAVFLADFAAKMEKANQQANQLENV